MIELTDTMGKSVWLNRAYVVTVSPSLWSDYSTPDEAMKLPYTMRDGSNIATVGVGGYIQVREKPSAVIAMLSRVKA